MIFFNLKSNIFSKSEFLKQSSVSAFIIFCVWRFTIYIIKLAHLAHLAHVFRSTWLIFRCLGSYFALLAHLAHLWFSWLTWLIWLDFSCCFIVFIPQWLFFCVFLDLVSATSKLVYNMLLHAFLIILNKGNFKFVFWQKKFLQKKQKKVRVDHCFDNFLKIIKIVINEKWRPQNVLVFGTITKI